MSTGSQRVRVRSAWVIGGSRDEHVWEVDKEWKCRLGRRNMKLQEKKVEKLIEIGGLTPDIYEG